MIHISIERYDDYKSVEGKEKTQAFFQFCRRHFDFLSIVMEHRGGAGTDDVAAAKNTMDAALNKIIKKYKANEDGFAEDFRTKHSIHSDAEFNQYVEKIKEENAKSLEAYKQDELKPKKPYILELEKLGMLERVVTPVTEVTIGQTVDMCFFPANAISDSFDNLNDLFQRPIIVADCKFEDWTFYRKDYKDNGTLAAWACSHERFASLVLTEWEYNEFKGLGIEHEILDPNDLRENYWEIHHNQTVIFKKWPF